MEPRSPVSVQSWRPTKIEVDLSVIAENLRILKSISPQSKTMLAVKANAYGHGALEVARSCESGVDGFAVASLDEAVELRREGIEKPILLLQGHFSREELAIIYGAKVWTSIHSDWQIEELISFGAIKCDSIWIKVDSGMHRFGFDPRVVQNILKRCERLGNYNGLTLFTHMSSADEPNLLRTHQQNEIISRLASETGLSYSCANSASLLLHPQTHADWNRIGIAAYASLAAACNEERLRSAMHFKSKVTAIRTIASGEGVGYNHAWTAPRDTVIATVPVGYGDGYPRHAASGTPILINGALCSLVGKVSMDAITVDITDYSERVAIGSEVELWGGNLAVETVAKHAKTISYDLLTRISDRPERIYF
jgi:alanine racemase